MPEIKGYIEAQKWILSTNQVKLLNYIGQHGPIILENAYKKLGMSKPTAGYHVKKLEAYGFVEVIGATGRTKPLKLTELGEAVLDFLNGKAISDEARINISIIELILALDLTKLKKDEISNVIEVFQEELEKRKVSKKDQPMFV